MNTSARTRFAALTSGPDGQIPLDEAALLIAAEHSASLDMAAARRTLDGLAARTQERVSGAGDQARLTALTDTLSGDDGFRGNTDDYYDPRNSFLNDVLERRVGIPITLSVVYLEVARRIDLPLIGVNFPGHFLIRYPGPEPPVVLDVFAGAAVVTDAVLRDRIQRAYQGIDDAGAEAMLTRLLHGAARKDILARMLTNLKMIFLHRQELESAIAAIDRILVLHPAAAEELRDRGAAYHTLECFGAALADYTRYLALRPTAADASTIGAVVAELRHLAAHVH